jgi:hypothetical protein
MAGNSLGALLVKLGLDSAEFTSGLTKSQYQAQKFADSMSNNVAVGIIKAEVAMQAFIKAAEFAFHEIPDLLKQAGHFEDLATKIGGNAEEFASLAVAAKTADTEIDFVADTSIKLQKNLAKVDDTSTGAGRAIKALGLNLKEFKSLSPTDQLDALAKALAGFQDEGKPVILEALVKGGAQLLPFLKDLGTETGRVNILSAEQIRIAKEFSDKQAKTRAELNLYAQALSTEMVPAITAFTGALTDVIKELLGLDKASGDLKNGTAVADFAEEGARSLATLTDEAYALAQSLNLIAKSYGAAAAIAGAIARREFSSVPAIIKAAREEGEKMTFSLGLADKVDARFAQMRKDRAAGPTTGDFARADRKKLDTSGLVDGAGDQARAVLKKRLEGDLKLIRDFAEQQKSGYEFMNQLAKGSYDDGLTSLADFFEAQKVLRAQGLQAEIDALDKSIAKERAYISNPLIKGDERVEAEGKIKDAVEKRALAIQKASQQNILSEQEEARAFKQLAFQYYDFLATVKDQQGDATGSAALRIAKQAQDAQELLTKVGFDPASAKSQADAYAQKLTAQSSLNIAQADYNRLVDIAGVKEKEALLAGQLSGESELETLTKVGAIRQDALGALGELVTKAQELALVLGTPEAQLFAAKLALQFKQAAAEADPLLAKTRDLGKELGDAIASGFGDAIVQGKGLREVLKGIEQDLLNILIRSQFTKPLGDFLSNAIGGNGTSSGGGGMLAKLLPGVFGGGSINAAGGAASAGFGTGAAFGNLDFGGFLAGGGSVANDKFYRVNEQAPELFQNIRGEQFLMNATGKVIPTTPGNGSGGATVFNINVAGGTSYETAAQIAETVNRKLAAGRRVS